MAEINGVPVLPGQIWKNRKGSIVEIGGVNHQYITGSNGGKFHPNGRLYTDLACSFDLVTLVRQAPGYPMPDASESLETSDADAIHLPGIEHTVSGASVEGIISGPGYQKLLDVLLRAHDQAANGKGKERHARDNIPFHEQPMATINKQIGSVDGFIYQAHKKSLEALRLPHGRNIAELLGAINYLAGAVIALESWASKENSNA